MHAPYLGILLYLTALMRLEKLLDCAQLAHLCAQLNCVHTAIPCSNYTAISQHEIAQTIWHCKRRRPRISGRITVAKILIIYAYQRAQLHLIHHWNGCARARRSTRVLVINLYKRLHLRVDIAFAAANKCSGAHCLQLLRLCAGCHIRKMRYLCVKIASNVMMRAYFS